MQNSSQTFRGSAAPGVNFPDHSYDNHLGGGHCQSGGYQAYPNQAYHSRPHHYGNHQLQQNMPYRHHAGGAYVPNQNQYGSNMNQDMYRNHHPGYAGNNRNIPAKTWTENNNSGELMPPYGQASPHSQMMNNPSQIPVNTMRSPTHAASNMNPSPQGQHYRSMQSPAHSPHSWSQAQIPSPGMMHSSRTSPLPAHVRSPGHSQPFSPPSAHSMNLQSHLPPQENGQLPQPVGNSGGNENHNPANPLHSLQKMVLLDQDAKVMMGLPNDGSEQFQNQCGPQNFGSDQCPTDLKDSQYSTYYNMDENRFESKPSAGNDASVYAPVQQVANCSYPASQNSGSNESDANVVRVPSSVNPNSAEAYHANPNHANSMQSQINVVQQSQCKSNAPQNDCSMNQTECPPHAESAPVFTDQTKAAVSTNSEQALESKSNSNCVSQASDPETACVAQVSNSDAAGIPLSSSLTTPCLAPESSSSSHVNVIKEPDPAAVSIDKSCDDHDINAKESNKNDTVNPSICTPLSESQDCDSNITSSDSKSSNCEDSQESEKKVTSTQGDEGSNNEEASSSKVEVSLLKVEDSPQSKSSKEQNPIEIDANYVQRNPVKVVIHRIRKNDADDTWHVPGNVPIKIKVEEENEDNSSEAKKSTAPQIIMLSQAVDNKTSECSNSSNSVNDADGNQVSENNSDANPKIENETSSEKISNVEKKKLGRPFGSKNKNKPNSVGKGKQKGRKGAKKRKNDKFKTPETVAKVKKVSKTFNGPYVRITGSKENPATISVVNVAQREEEKLTKTQTKRTPSSAVNRIKSKTVGHLSTLSPTYDAYNRDKTWVCIFCQKGSHHGGLGDLYGPYYIKDNSENKLSTSTPGTSGTKRKRKKSEAEDSKAPKQIKQSAQSTPAKHGDDKDADSEPMREVWIHEDCAVWCQSITLLGEEVRGLDEAVSEANEIKCSHCSFTGATLGCWGKSCKEMYHYSCAKTIGCQLDIEKFSLLCRKHQKNASDSRNRCQ